MGSQLKIISSAYFQELERALGSADTLDRYRQSEPIQLDDDRLLLTPIVIEQRSPELVVAEGRASRARDDAQNAIKIYQWLPRLSRTQAWDRRLWATLCHHPFFGYVRSRWTEFTSDARKDATYVARHWFLGAKGKAALRTNAIARLWWAAHLTWKPWEKDPELGRFETTNGAHYTEILLSNQQFYFDIVERDFGSNLRVRICLLDALQERRDEVASDTSLSGEVAKRLNLVARTRHLDAMSVEELHELCRGLVDREVTRANSEQNGRSADATS